MRVVSWIVVAFCLLCACREARAAVISIDFGAEWVKVALVKPGVPMEIVLNKESKRKSSAAVAMRNGERNFGDDALATAVKYPKSAYQYLQMVVGQKFKSPLVTKFKRWFPYYEISEDEERGTVVFHHDSETEYSPEELIGMMLNYSRSLAQDYAGQSIRDVVITVPSFFNQAQRRAMLHAAELVGLNVLQLMTDAAATALNYGLFRQDTFNTTPQYIMLYDMGALSTTATIVEYRTTQVKEGSLANTYPQLTVKGTGFDRTLGGLEMDVRLRDMLAERFELLKKTQGSVYDSPRAMAKLLKEAKKLKHVLSANTNHLVQIEGLLEDVDFKTKVTREEFEELCADLFDRVGKPVIQALQAADMTMGEIESVILVGGGTRVPRIQDALLAIVNKSELGRNLNTDESPALGAVYQAAGLTKLFRVKKFIVKDGNVYPVQVSFTRITEDENGTEQSKIVTRTLFRRSNAYPQKKLLTFNRYISDFAFSVFYGDLDFLSDGEKSYVGRLDLMDVFLAGVTDTLATHSTAEATGIKAHFRMDESGLLTLDYVESVFEYPEAKQESTFSKISSTLSNLFGGGGDAPDEGGEGQGGGVAEDTTGKPVGGEGESRQEGEGRDNSANDTTPTDEETTPTEEEPSPNVEGDTRPTEEDTKPSEGDIDEGDEGGTRLTEGDTRPTEDNGTSGEEGDSKPTEGDTRPTEGDSGPTDEATKPTEGDTRPTEEDNKPTEGDTRPTEGDTGPTEGDTGPTEGDTGPTEGDTGPTEGDTRPTEGDTGPTEGDTGPTEGDTGPTEKVKEKAEPKGEVVKVNLTAEIMTLDLPPLTETQTKRSVEKLRDLQQRDEDRLANEQARNDLESHIFEYTDLMEAEAVVAVSTEDQREAILVALREAYNWLEEDGYAAETREYKERHRSLKRASRALVRRVREAAITPKLVATLSSSLNLSRDFLFRMRNLSDELQILTEVEMTTLETLANETQEWLTKKVMEQLVTPSHEEPVLLSYEIEEQTKRLDRELMYLFNKLRTHPGPKPKTPLNATNGTSNGTNTTASETSNKTSGADTDTEYTSGSEEDASDREEPSKEEEEEVEEPVLPEPVTEAETAEETTTDNASPDQPLPADHEEL